MILVVDDSPAIRELVGEVLTARGHVVTTVASGRRALAEMDLRRPELAIIDLLMPGITGFELRARMLRRTDLADVPVIVLSAWWRRPAETLAAVDVLSKPIDLDLMIDTVERTLKGRGSASDAERLSLPAEQASFAHAPGA